MMIAPNQTLPDIVFQTAAQYLVSAATSEPPILIFLDGQYIFRYQEDGRTYWKLLKSSTIAAAFSFEPVDTGWLSQNIVRHGICAAGKWYVRFCPPRKHHLTFHLDEDSIQKINAPLPGLVFFSSNQRCYVWAIKEAEFDKDALLYHAPLPNVDNQGLICFGNNAVTGEVEKDWRLFLESAFNNHNIDSKSRKCKKDIRQMLFNLADRDCRKYPLNDLEPIGIKITVDWRVSYLLKELS